MTSLSRPKILAGRYIVEFEDIKIVKHMEPKHIDRIVVTPCFTMLNMSCIMRKTDFCLCENKGADQLRGNREADQRLCFHYTDSIFPLLLISEISSF